MLVKSKHQVTSGTGGATSAVFHAKKPFYTAPDCRFVYSSADRFIYFSNSQYSSEHTFGLSSDRCVELIAALKDATFAELDKDEVQELETAVLKEAVTRLVLKAYEIKRASHSTSDIQREGHSFGHIPIMMLGVGEYAPAKYSFRDISANDVSQLFHDAPRSEQPVREYVKKQMIMRAVSDYRQYLVQLRNQHGEYRDAMVLLNRLIHHVDELVNANLASMPKHEEFYYCHAFAKELSDAINVIPQKYDTQRRQLISAFTHAAQGHYKNGDVVQAMSNSLYDILGQIFSEMGFSPASEEKGLTKIQCLKLQCFMPLLICLNSAYNPYARNGLFGKPLDSHLHAQALKTYNDHESEARTDIQEQIRILSNKAPQRFESDFVYSDAQVAKSLFGFSQQPAQQASFIGFVSSAMSYLTNSVESPSQNRVLAQALPAPETHLMLEWKPADDVLAPGAEADAGSLQHK